MPKVEKQEKKTKEKKSTIKKTGPKKPSYFFAVGRRKTAVATVKLFVNGTGEMKVNQKPIEEYFRGNLAKYQYLLPFTITDTLNRFTVEAKIKGSGLSSQLAALVHAFSRALEKVDREKYRPLLKKQGLLTRDSRKKERKKPGLMGARTAKQSPKR